MQQTLAGIVERVTFHNDENGFCVLRVKTPQSHVVTVVGRLPRVTAGEYLDAVGNWIQDREHGRQFKADELRVSPPSTTEGIEKYLGSGMIEGVGPHFASRLVEAFGDKVFDVIEQRPELLLQVSGIGKERQKRILEAWKDQKSIREIMVFLHSHGVGTARAFRIYKTYGTDALELVRRNPYRLASEISGIGFRSADQIAASLGIARDSPLRAAAGLLFTLKELSGAGHGAYPMQRWLERATELLDIPGSVLETAARQVIDAGEVTLGDIEIDGDAAVPCAYLTHLYRAEEDLARRLRTLLAVEHPLAALDTDRALAWVEQRVGLELAPSQKAALAKALRSKVAVITGGPGVGKTTLVKSLLEIFRAKKLRCLCCAPTGRAARRLAETTRSEAKTVHRLLEFKPGRGSFTYDDRHRLEGDVVILDEASMMDVVLMDHLVRAIPPHAAFVLVGDVDQLPSVGPGQILRDCIDSGVLPVVRLTEIFRQSSASRIITSAHSINSGRIPDTEYPSGELGDFYFVEANEPQDVVDKICTIVKERIPERFGLDPIQDVQVLTPMKRSLLGADALNHRLQEILNPHPKSEVKRFGWTFRTGDKVMQIENNYDKEVFNGDIGRIVGIDLSDSDLRVDYNDRLITYTFDELDEIVPAYACSIHKSQGSEYPAVVIPVHTQHYIMLQRNVLYTGVTRAQKLVTLVGSRRALALAVEREDQARRITGLRGRLREPG